MNFHTFIYRTYIRFILAIVGLIFLSGCAGEYQRHFVSEHSTSRAISGEYYIPTQQDGIWILPQKSLKKDIITFIENSHKKIWIQIYMWTDKDIARAVIDAHKRGVDVRVLLERNVYGLPRVNIPVFTEFVEAGIPVKYTDSYRFTFTHSKFWIIDDMYFISTGNFTKSFFESNRDFIFYGSDAGTHNFLSDLFSGDMSYLGIDRSLIPDHIVVSPIDARSKIAYLIESAKEDIKVYTQTLTDDHLIEVLSKKRGEGINVSICTADNESNRISSSGSVVPWVLAKKPYLHGKIVFIDSKHIFIGSQNFTHNSLENNRELGIILTHTGDIFSDIYLPYTQDCIFQ